MTVKVKEPLGKVLIGRRWQARVSERKFQDLQDTVLNKKEWSPTTHTGSWQPLGKIILAGGGADPTSKALCILSLV